MTTSKPDLTELRKVARAATPGPWVWSKEPDGWGDNGPNLETVERGPICPDGSQGAREQIVSSWGHDAHGICVEDANAAHVETFDPPTVLALLDCMQALIDRAEGEANRAEASELDSGVNAAYATATRANVEFLLKEREGDRSRVLAAEAQVAAVRELHKPRRYRREGSRDTGIPEFVCEACHAANWGAVEHPCPTIRALDGQDA